MSGQTTAWLVLFLLGVFLIVVGATGSLGKLFAVAFTPSLLENKYGGSASGTF